MREGLPDNRNRVVGFASTRGHVHRVERHKVQVPQSTGQVGIGTVFGIPELPFEVGLVSIGVVRFRDKGVVELDGHLLDHGVQEVSSPWTILNTNFM